jgi:hypothetical protein
MLSAGWRRHPEMLRVRGRMSGCMGLFARFFIFRSITGLPMGGIASDRDVAICGRDTPPASARGPARHPRPAHAEARRRPGERGRHVGSLQRRSSRGGIGLLSSPAQARKEQNENKIQHSLRRCTPAHICREIQGRNTWRCGAEIRDSGDSGTQYLMLYRYRQPLQLSREFSIVSPNLGGVPEFARDEPYYDWDHRDGPTRERARY